MQQRVMTRRGVLRSILHGAAGGSLASVLARVAGAKPRAVSLDDYDHSPYDKLLHRYVDGDGMVNYRAWKASSTDRAALKSYLGGMASADPSLPASRAGRLAFWINAYNALTIHGILGFYPTSSIRNHTSRFFDYNIWDDLLLQVGNRKYSLNNIEHDILRKMGEPRIHFAIVCASKGCPRLRNEAYTRDRIEEQLADNARDFFSRRKHFYIDYANNTVYVSSILKWFQEDFGPSPQAAVRSMAAYMPERAAQYVRTHRFTVRYLSYDWSLNEQS